MATYVTVLTLSFGLPLARLMQHAAGSALHSHIVLVPFIVGYLLHERRDSLPGRTERSVTGTILLGTLGLASLAAAFIWRSALSANDYLAFMALAYVALLAAGGFFFRGAAWMSAAAFPVGFLIFLVPLPDALVYWLERGSVVASAEAAALYFWMADTPLVRHGTLFELPGLTLQVAQECSGIRSSWVLFITSALAAHMFLRNPWHRVLLVAFVIPLGILRNGFRVFVLGMLGVHVGPHMLDTPIHHQGGPLFFALSLGPLFLLIWWLRRRERRRGPASMPAVQGELTA